MSALVATVRRRLATNTIKRIAKQAEKLKSASKRRHDVMLAPVVAMMTTSFTQNERYYSRRFVLEDGRNVSYSVVGNPDGQPVFVFLVRRVPVTDRQSRDREGVPHKCRGSPPWFPSLK